MKNKPIIIGTITILAMILYLFFPEMAVVR